MSVTKKEFQRLSTNVSPVNYNLWLKPTLETFTFDGKEDIEVKVRKINLFYSFKFFKL